MKIKKNRFKKISTFKKFEISWRRLRIPKKAILLINKKRTL